MTFKQTQEHLRVETHRQGSDRLGYVDLLKVGATAWNQKEHITFSDMLRAVRMVISRDNCIFRKATPPALKNITREIVDCVDDPLALGD